MSNLTHLARREAFLFPAPAGRHDPQPEAGSMALRADLRSRPVRSEALTTARVIEPAIRQPAIELARPAWSTHAVPIRVLQPVTLEPPIRADRFILWPDLNTDTVIVASAELSLASFALTLQRSLEPDRSLRITGGTAVITVSVYLSDDLPTLDRFRRDWSVALSARHFGERPWKYRPLERRSLEAELSLPGNVAAVPPRVVTSPDAGTATFIVELTEHGALTWKAALEQGAASSLAGVCRATVSYLRSDGVRMNVERQSVETPLGTLLAGRGPTDIRVIDPQQAVQATLLVVGHGLMETATVALRPNQGQAPANQVFGPAGGQVEVTVTTQDVNGVVVDWSTQVAFRSTGWPPVPASGRLSAANGWTELIKPDSWVTPYTLMAILVDERGRATPFSEAGQNYHVQGVLTFTAPYVGGGILVSAFAVENQLPVTTALPRYPGQPFGDLVLNMFTTRNNLGGTATRKLAADELAIVVLVYPDAHLEIRTGRDALGELSLASEWLGRLHRL